jgi:hypothetical protein
VHAFFSICYKSSLLGIWDSSADNFLHDKNYASIQHVFEAYELSSFDLHKWIICSTEFVAASQAFVFKGKTPFSFMLLFRTLLLKKEYISTTDVC